ncbi:MAG: DUF559 domain-containing protein [Leeuwenhoekiella sp.]
MKPTKTQLARHLRQEQTEAEKELWGLLRNRKFLNLKFRRQHPLKDYIVDFYCLELGLIIELDGGYHNNPEQKEKDNLRDLHFKALGYWVLRFKNDVVFQSPKEIFEAIENVKEHRDKNPVSFKRSTTYKKSPSPAGKGWGEGSAILSTKKLKLNQRELLLNTGVSFVDYDAIKIEPKDFQLPWKMHNLIFTSKNAVNEFLNKMEEITPLPEGEGPGVRFFCVGTKTKTLLEKHRLIVEHTAQNAFELGDFLIKKHRDASFHFFCGNLRRQELPDKLKQNGINLEEIEVYQTVLNPKAFERKFDAVLFFSPSGVQSFAEVNGFGESLAVCIGSTTASEAKKFTKNIAIANATSVESVIAKAVKLLNEKSY